MQKDAINAFDVNNNLLITSPTGSGKTLAFLLPIIKQLNAETTGVQAVIVAPTRELAIQIENVARNMGSGFKTNVVYGGRSGSKDKIELKHNPAILVGTPGRLADHIYRENIDISSTHTLVLDEFDKTLEIGFENEMIEIMDGLPFLKKRILTSATNGLTIPPYVGFTNSFEINNIQQHSKQSLRVVALPSPEKDKLKTLTSTLKHLGNQPTIIFCNFKETIGWLSSELQKEAIEHECFYGGMEQRDREEVLIKFRNGSCQLLIATDLAARGIDVPEIKNILHFQLPPRREEYIHRNGRTARMHNTGTAYVLHWNQEELPDFVELQGIENHSSNKPIDKPAWKTLFINGGRKEKISKGDIMGLFIKQGNLAKEDLGRIELKTNCSYVAIKAPKANKIANSLNNSRLKKKKVRMKVI